MPVKNPFVISGYVLPYYFCDKKQTYPIYELGIELAEKCKVGFFLYCD